MNKNNSMSIINEHIKKQSFSSIYLLFGEEHYLLQQYKGKLCQALLPPEDTMNLSVYKGDHCDVDSIINDCQTLPFFAERRVVLVEDSGFFKSANDALADSLSDIPESTCLIFCEQDVDKRGRLYKAAAKYGSVLSFDTPDEKTLLSWLKSILQADGIQVRDAAVYQLLEAVGSDMTRLRNEAEKLIDYCYEKKEITAADVMEICVSQTENKIFDLTDAIAKRDKGTAIRLYNDLLQLREPAMRILFLIHRHYMILAQMKRMLLDRADASQIASLLKIPPFTVKKYAAQCRNYDYKNLLHKVDLCQGADYAIKSGQLSDKSAVEMLIIDLIHEDVS